MYLNTVATFLVFFFCGFGVIAFVGDVWGIARALYQLRKVRRALSELRRRSDVG